MELRRKLHPRRVWPALSVLLTCHLLLLLLVGVLPLLLRWLVHLGRGCQ
jgi:hypothetical protein